MSRSGGANKEIMEAWLQEYMKPGTVTVIVADYANYKKSGVVKQIGLKKASSVAYQVFQWKGCEGSFKLISGTLAMFIHFIWYPRN